MDLPYQLPLIAQLISDDCTDDGFSADTDYIFGKTAAAKAAGANLLLAPTDDIRHGTLEEISSDNEFADLFGRITASVFCHAGTATVRGGVIAPPSELPEYSCGVFEDAYFDYLETITLLKDHAAELVLMKNCRDLWNIRAALLAANAVGIPFFAIMEADSDGQSNTGADAMAALITLQAMGAAGFGISCGDDVPTAIRLLSEMSQHSEIPLIYCGSCSALSEQEIRELTHSGSAVFIDTAPEVKPTVYNMIKEQPICFDREGKKDSYAAAVEHEPFFLPEDIELSEPMECSYDMSDDLIDLDDEDITSVLIRLNSTDDAAILTENAFMTRLPITIHANDPTVLEAALRYFSGRLIVDTRCDISPEELRTLAAKYGAILY